jgi:hypothetical protein
MEAMVLDPLQNAIHIIVIISKAVFNIAFYKGGTLPGGEVHNAASSDGLQHGFQSSPRKMRIEILYPVFKRYVQCIPCITCIAFEHFPGKLPLGRNYKASTHRGKGDSVPITELIQFRIVAGKHWVKPHVRLNSRYILSDHVSMYAATGIFQH